ncbi:DUF4242 domain-containing protein [Diaminobutyricibacter tongyongensis]|uniref:DUF4242 domain-containing protein n=1 Tax=Leifsonia tongyongensis TaxID=1268043 RepID=A0A6L9XY59_9MICO|nr:nickel-binding protein [Diaminobutyricibacter tongyongensis]NEN06343.1 DUF4242 domain-containing protein [Diaminobutyricibacter tongyongensis]
MPFFVIERNYADQIEIPLEAAPEINLINDEEDVRWLYSFLSIDHRKSYCLYEAPSIEAIRAAAARAGMPIDSVVEVEGRVMPSGQLIPLH